MMNFKQFEHPFDGKIISVEFDIRKLREMSRNDYLKELWKEYRMTDEPVIILCPFMKTGIWKQISLTNIYLTCDSLDRNIELELRTILAPQPNIFQRIYIVTSNLFSNNQIKILEQLAPQPTQIRFS